jgi:tRNA pseudouridine38-40 synthase
MARSLIKLLVAYDGTGYRGWQRTRMGPSIQETLETAIFEITRERVTVEGASRTDAGVHAAGQLAVFATSRQLGLDRWRLGINAFLPPQIRVLRAEEILTQADPTKVNFGKEYHYLISLGPVQLPHLRHYAWHCHYPLNLSAMRAACSYLVGAHDFSSFCNVHKELPRKVRVRELQALEIRMVEKDLLSICMIGKSFLLRMARIIAGTLVWVGRGKLQPEQLPAILRGCQRPLAGVTAPARGLRLMRILEDNPRGLIQIHPLGLQGPFASVQESNLVQKP